MLETVEHGIAALGRAKFCVWNPYLSTVEVPLNTQTMFCFLNVSCSKKTYEKTCYEEYQQTMF